MVHRSIATSSVLRSYAKDLLVLRWSYIHQNAKDGSAEDVMTAKLANQLTASILAYPAMVEKPASACPKIGGTARRDTPYFDISNL